MCTPCSALSSLLIFVAVACLATSYQAQAQGGVDLATCKAASEIPTSADRSGQASEIARAVYDIREEARAAKLDDALNTAQALVQKYPSEASLQAVLGEVYYRRGELAQAVPAINRAVQLDPCYPRAHFDAWQVFELTGMRRTGQQQLDIARQLDGKDTVIDWAWEHDKGQFESGNGIECRLVGEPAIATIRLDPRKNQSNLRAGASLAVRVNGRSTQLVMDSSDPAITLSEADAKRAGIVAEHTFTSAPHAATGSSSISGYTSHIKILQIGSITLENCPVTVIVSPPVAEGGIGFEPFHDFRITIDVQHERLALGPLPPIPLSARASSGTASPTEDRIIPVEFKDWLRFYQPPTMHRALLPVKLGNAGTHLFILDTGSSTSYIDPDAAREVTHVSRDFAAKVSGYGGMENDVYNADKVQLQVGAVSRTYEPMQSWSKATKSDAAGIRVSGILGFDLVRDLIIQNDYRDLLIDLEPNGEEIRKSSHE